ncbi:MAG: SRPBCC family protein [Methylococcaceae bacterium]|nr:SRPBCC family protein [Methylococcaceae bacterium]
MTCFHLTTTWKIPASLENCWFSILEVESWPNWWKYVHKVIELEAGDKSGINNIHQYDWSTCLPYHLVFNLRVTRLEPFKLITFDAQGDLTGNGCCRFTQKNNCTYIQFDWNVETSKPWMSFVATIATPVFEWNHRRVMKSGEQSLIRKLNSTP